MKERFAVWMLKLLGRLPLSVGRVFGGFAGWLMWLSSGRSARITRQNLALCQPHIKDRARERLVRQSLTETGKTVAEAAAVWLHSWEWLQRHIVEVENDEALKTALTEGQGVLVLAPHLGNWEAVGPFLASYARLTALYQPPRQPALDEMILKGRSKDNIDMAPTNRRGVSQLLKALKRGEIVAILPDQVPERGNGAEVAPFFGQPALTMTLVHGLIQRTGCKVVSVFAQRVPKGFKMVVLPADERIYAEDANASVAGLNRSVEDCVLRAPTQYQWEYKRFRRLPDDYAPRY
ncbi:lysophospholipid acyltransferase family protein [Marinimicrobium sp. LS-A18]|uniref:lysophospholipid acyltransferase family protein n=1 Tax=Marinimicrobium sp. LS-A18 TaxID=1381596 RepID=UPI0004660C74|nr:lysophospholipid acyltransferase family protein [Marinimicrobium sp. LS-A18]